jgi:hypothetical protein
MKRAIFIAALQTLALAMATRSLAQGFGGPLGEIPQPAIPDVAPRRTCESLMDVAFPDVVIESAELDQDGSGHCRVSAIKTNPPMGDEIRIWIGIPTANWNGRFLGTGGGGFSGGGTFGINRPLALGYASGATDTGHQGGSGSFALDSNDRLNWQLIRDNAHVGIHEMTITGKALTEALYGVAPRYSYFNGCSTGGRQGLMEAQRYPQDYDGIVSAAPAINWVRFIPQELWGAVVMNEEDNPIPACKLAAATAAAIEACDTIDGVEDGVIEDPVRCEFDPESLVGTSAGACGAFTAVDASIIRQFWDGPRGVGGKFLWYGLPRGADLNALWGGDGEPLRPRAFSISLDWFRYFLAEDPDLDWTSISPARYERYFEQSVEQFSEVIATDNPDLAAFRDRGGKLLIWHGWADQLISAHGTVDYYERVVDEMGGAEETAEFARLFMAPGVGHCAGGAGPSPVELLDTLRVWVEEGDAPEILRAESRDQTGEVSKSRPLCPYPLVASYSGNGSTDNAANFACASDF